MRSLREFVTLEPDADDHEVIVRRVRAMESTLAEREAAAEAEARERAALEAERQRLEAERQALEAQVGAPPPEPEPRGRRLAPWIVGGVGAGLLLNAAVNGIVACGANANITTPPIPPSAGPLSPPRSPPPKWGGL